MSLGIYFHIPFCKQRCIYCDFVSSTNIEYKSLIIDAMIEEIKQVEIPASSTVTLYFGGGTPSVLEINEIERLLSAVKNRMNVPIAETTIEVNPDDVTLEYLQSLRHLGIDRISIGIQSFADKDLQFLNRRHSSQQAQEAVLDAHKAGFNNISVDLMYGLPQCNAQDFKNNLLTLLNLPITHFSAYHLSIEKNTPLYRQYKRDKIILPTEEESINQFNELENFAEEQGFIHYEISNFCKPKYYSIHNSNYWKNFPYIGVGVGAHGYDGKNNRFENPAEISTYLEMINHKKCHQKVEKLTQKEKFNEALFIGLRTMWGVDVKLLLDYLSSSEINMFKKRLNTAIEHQHIFMNENTITIPKKYWFIADAIIRDLMM